MRKAKQKIFPVPFTAIKEKLMQVFAKKAKEEHKRKPKTHTNYHYFGSE